MGNRLALLIGVSEYEPGFGALPCAVRDVEAMRRVLVHPQMGEFAPDAVTVLKNPLRQEMEMAIDKLFADRARDDLLLLYFSGHGVKDDRGGLFLTSQETQKTTNGSLVKPTAVAAQMLHNSMNESRSQHQVMILDCCFSGAIAQGLTVKDDGKVDLQGQLGGRGRAILTSSSSLQYAFEQEESELSVYTRYLVEGIEKGAADRDGDGWIGVDELHGYASEQVQEVAPAMTPKFFPVEEGYKIRLARAPVGDPKVIYRKEVVTIARESDGEISFIDLEALAVRRDDLRVSPTEAERINAEVLEPYRQRRAKFLRYEQVFTQAIAQRYPLSERDRLSLGRLQGFLRLRDEDVAAIEEQVAKPIEPREPVRHEPVRPISPPVASPPQSRTAPTPQPRELRSSQPVSPPLSRRQMLKVTGFGSLGLGMVVLLQNIGRFFPSGNSPTSNPKSLPISLESFGFETVTVNAQGKESNRQRKQAQYFVEDLGNGMTLEMVSIPAGEFVMGSPEAEKGRYDSESPQHTVKVPAFFMGKFEVTQVQWAAVAKLPKVKIDLNSDPSNFKGAKRPVENISWFEAVEFCDRLSEKTGRSYRLPSEAAWEYACRAGTKTPFHFGETITTDLVNFDGRSTYASAAKGQYRQQTTEVGSFPANAFGLYDMHGNVWEWCFDHWQGDYQGAPTDGSAWISKDKDAHRLLRGGSWYVNPRYCRSASRNDYVAPDFRYYVFGFRVVCSA